MATSSQKVRRGVTRHPSRRRPRRKLVLDAYRADVSGLLLRVLGAAAALVLLGSVLTGSALVTARLDGVPVVVGRRPHDLGEASQRGNAASPSALALGLGLSGLALVLGGAAAAIVGLRHVLRQERYLLLRKDGAVFVRGELRRVVKWHDVEDVVHEDGQLVLRCHDGTALTVEERYGGVSLPELAKRVAQLRRRAVFGLIR